MDENQLWIVQLLCIESICGSYQLSGQKQLQGAQNLKNELHPSGAEQAVGRRLFEPQSSGVHLQELLPIGKTRE